MKIHSIALLIMTIILFGCEGPAGTNGPAGPMGPAGSVLTGDIVGRVYIYNSLDEPTEFGGALIKIEGTTYSTISDSTGKWKLKGVKSGTYVISCSKVGFSIDKNVGFQLVGGDTPASGGFFELYKLPTRYVSSLEIPQPYQNGVSIVGTLSSPLNVNEAQMVFTFVGYDSIPSILAYNYITYSFNVAMSTPTFNIVFNSSIFINAKIKSGTKLYFVSHTVANTYAGYPDFDAGFVLTGLCEQPSNVVSYIVP